METVASHPGAQLIVTADDFGRSSAINHAILRAHREGILTTASLMVAGEAAEEAIAMARETPTLAVGLHVVLVDGPAMLSGADAPRLFSKGQHGFSNSPVALGLRYALGPRTRREMMREVEAQFAAFARSGLRFSHVDAHQHMHLHPAIFPLLARMAREYQADGIRLPRDDLRLALGYDAENPVRKIVWAAALGAMSGWCARRTPAGLRTPTRCYGLFQSGQMQEGYVIQLLRSLGAPSAEVYFHPTLGPRADPYGPNPEDLSTLISPAVRNVIDECRIRLCSYRDLLP